MRSPGLISTHGPLCCYPVYYQSAGQLAGPWPPQTSGPSALLIPSMSLQPSPSGWASIADCRQVTSMTLGNRGCDMVSMIPENPNYGMSA